MSGNLKQSGLVLAVIILCLSGLFDFLYQVTPLPAFEKQAGDYLADVRERATYAYAAARALNATISLLESVEVGAVLSLQPGQVLEPVNDMIEQFSDLILIALASVGVQEILVKVLHDVSWTYLLPLALAPALVAPFCKNWKTRLNQLSFAFVSVVIASRLLIPAIALGGHAITENYLRSDLDQALQQVETVRQKTAEAVRSSPRVSQPLPPEITTPSSSIFSKPAPRPGDNTVLPDWDTVKGLADSDRLIALLNNIPERIVTLITIFAFETLALPLIVIMIFLWLGRRLNTLLSLSDQRHPYK